MKFVDISISYKFTGADGVNSVKTTVNQSKTPATGDNTAPPFFVSMGFLLFINYGTDKTCILLNAK